MKHCCLLAVISVLFGATVGSTAQAADSEENQTTPYASLDLAGRYNPVGVALTGELGLRHVFRIDREHEIPAHAVALGVRGSINPANAQAGLVLHYQPVVFAHFELGYERYAYFGTNGALLSYPDDDADFSDATRTARAGEEERAGGDRLSGTVTLQLAAGRWYARQQTRWSWYHFGGEGPWYYEWEHDTLLRNADWVLSSKTSASFALWKGGQQQLLLVGPCHDVTRAFDAALTRHRIAGFGYLQLGRHPRWGRPHVYAEVGTPLVDRHRRGEMYVLGLLGTSW